MDSARKGDNALSASKYDEAVQHYTDAISSNPTAVKYYIGRSTAYQRSAKYDEALSDAEVAVVLATKRGVRELIKDAQFRRALALFFHEKYGDTDFLLGIVKELDEKDKMLPIWNMKVATKLKELPEDDERRKVTVTKLPNIEAPSAIPSKPAQSTTNTTAKIEASSTASTQATPAAPTPANKVKIDWYQSNETVTISVMAKGVAKDSVNVEFNKDTLSVSFPIGDSSSEYNYSLDPLYASIDPAQSKYRVAATKVELTLKKASPGVKWHTLDSDRDVQNDEENRPAIPSHILSSKANDSAPAYPTSSKTGAKNWDKLAADDKEEGDVEEGDATSNFFKTLFKDATPESQRAMMKSYQESGGTVLSTNWEDVGARTVDPEPPEGMEAKKY